MAWDAKDEIIGRRNCQNIGKRPAGSMVMVDDRPTAFPLHNNEPELIDYFASPLGISKSICPTGVEFKRGRTSSSHLRKQMPFALHIAANEYSCYGKRKRKKKEG